MKKILFGITSLSLGGAERVLVDIVNNLSSKYDVTIFTLYSKGEFEKMISNNVQIISLYDSEYKEYSKIKRIVISLKLLLNKKKIYNKNIKSANYDTEIAFLEGPITRLLAVKNTNTKKIAWIHNDITQIFGKGIKSKIKRIYDKNIYNKYNNLVFVSKDNLQKFNEVYPNINNLNLIYNYIDSKNVLEKSNETIDFKFDEENLKFVTVARLTKQKAIDRLLKVHYKLITEGFIHKVYVIGDGPEKEFLEKTIKDYKVEDTFKLLGKKENPYPYIKRADVFCLLSLFEGYGMVLEEAKILDKFILITDTAAREAIEDYSNSSIVDNNEEAIYNEIKEIIQNKEKYKNRISEKIKFDNSNLIKMIEEIL